MQVRLTKWGNSLGLRIPKNVAGRMGLHDGSELEIAINGNHLTLTPTPPKYQLSELLQGMTPKALSDAFDWGDDVGREIVPE